MSSLPTKETKHKLEEGRLCVRIINCWYREQVLIFIYKFISPELLDSPSVSTPIKVWLTHYLFHEFSPTHELQGKCSLCACKATRALCSNNCSSVCFQHDFRNWDGDFYLLLFPQGLPQNVLRRLFSTHFKIEFCPSVIKSDFNANTQEAKNRWCLWVQDQQGKDSEALFQNKSKKKTTK